MESHLSPEKPKVDKPKETKTDNEKKRKSRSNFVLHTDALLYLLLKRGWTVKIVKQKTAKVTSQNYKCVQLSKKGMMIEECIGEEDLYKLGAVFEEIFMKKAATIEDKCLSMEQADLIPDENPSETVSEEKKDV
ncbi:hypothetical protein EIN_087170 [Entamoeba invadens IP1]|uniref:hypothetical protein n=1 Tax=Entamoeba invadens IP1 TaxID=370355 RepID=UPI0002C3E4CE|nr:hypothetical protein EIN_087170 [Entamoeba invadens IP1]ELP85415.1 hypothetical protein EIN_087170 [Entamoeba invadens IP1]|eukprot:XP_004184761.1 hypothetical protein EIN_087170 [Entamoeba invadens IP1]